MKHREDLTASYDHAISGLFLVLSLVLLVTLMLAIFCYGETFLLWHHPFSDLGNTVTRGGHPNTAARLVFSIGMIVEGALMLRIRVLYGKNPDLRNRTVKRWLALLGAIGFLIAIYPNDVNHLIHSIGVGIVIGVIYLFAMLFHVELKPRISDALFYLDLFIMQVSVFPYAWAFFTHALAKQTLQKTCVGGVFFALNRICGATEESFHPREALAALQRFQQ